MDEFQEISDFERKVIAVVCKVLAHGMTRDEAIRISTSLEVEAMGMVKEPKTFAEKKEVAKIFLLAEELVSLIREENPPSYSTEQGT